MRIGAILFGVGLMALGWLSFTAGGGGFPLILGVLVILLGLLQGRWEHNNPLYGTLMMAVLAILSSLRGVINLFYWFSGREAALSFQVVYAQAIIVGLSVLYIVLYVTLTPDFWHGWKAFGQFLGDWVARVALTVFYFTVLVPFGLGVRLLADPLHLKTASSSFWQDRATGDRNLKDVSRQF